MLQSSFVPEYKAWLICQRSELVFVLTKDLHSVAFCYVTVTLVKLERIIRNTSFLSVICSVGCNCP